MLSPANQRRRARQGRAGKHSPHQTVDPEELKSFWASLTLGKKLQVLQFEDRDLVERAYVIQQMLWYSELMCIKSGVRVSDGAGGGVRTLAMEAFEFKWHAPAAGWRRGCQEGGPTSREPGLHEVVPAAFAARPGFVGGADFLARLEHCLGSPLPDRSPALKREEWASVFEPTANSWSEYERQVWSLVRYALVQAHQDAAALATAEAAEVAEEQAALVEVPVDCGNLEDVAEDLYSPSPSGSTPSTKKKKKQRRKAAALAAAQVADGPNLSKRGASLSPIGEQAADTDEAEECDIETVGLEPANSNEENGDDEVEEVEEDEEDEEDEEEDEEEQEEEEEEEEAQADEVEDAEEEQAAALTIMVEEEEILTGWETVSSRKKDRHQPRTLATDNMRATVGQIASNSFDSHPAATEANASTHIQACDPSGSRAETHSGNAALQGNACDSSASSDPRPAAPAPLASALGAEASSTRQHAPSVPTAKPAVLSRAAPQVRRTPELPALLGAWPSNGLRHGAARWRMEIMMEKESICFIASVKRTFLTVEAAPPFELSRPRARSLDPAIFA